MAMDITNSADASDAAILRELGGRLRQRRLDKNWTQAALADRAGVNRTTVGDLERGKPSSLLTLVQVMRALGVVDQLSALVPARGPSPIELAKRRGRQRKRATGGPE